VEDANPFLDTSTIHWKPPNEGITLLELFGGISIGLAVVLQTSVKVWHYIYVDTNNMA